MASRSGGGPLVRALLAALPFLSLGVVLSIVVAISIDSQNSEAIGRSFRSEADGATASITREIERHAGAFDDVIRFSEATWPSETAEWSRFVTGQLNESDLPAFSSSAVLIERVPSGEVDDFVARERSFGDPDFTITELVPMGGDSDRLVLTRLAEENSNLPLRGLELSGIASTLGITLPDGSDEPALFSLDSDPGALPALLGISPSAIANESIEGTDALFIRGVIVDDATVGYVVAPIQLGGLLSKAVDGTVAPINISVRTMQFDGGRDVGRYIGSSDIPVEDSKLMSGDTYEFAGLTWQIDVWADRTFGAGTGVIRGVHGLLIGLLLTAMLGALVAYRHYQEAKLMAAKVEASLQRTLAETDSLTGLLNRQGLAARLNEAEFETAGGTLFFIDLDDFKQVNDRFGHHAGDRALRSVGAQLRSAARSDDLIARLGGDEFVVVCPGLQNDRTIAGISERMKMRVAEIEDPCSIRVSVGVAAGVGGLDAILDDLLERADAQMYEVKKAA